MNDLTSIVRNVSIYHDGEGWVSSCTDTEVDGSPIMGRVGLTEALESADWEDAMREAARHWGVSPEEVTVAD